MMSFSFAQPIWLLLFLLIPIVIYARKQPQAEVFYSKGSLLRNLINSTDILRQFGIMLRLIVLSLLIIAMARPQLGQEKSKQKTEGLDMMLVVDTSGSMRGMDFIINGERQNRLFVAKEVLKDFIEKRRDDRLGLTIFGTKAFAYVPMTLDHDVLIRYLDEVEIGMAGESTAIGDAIGIASNRLKDLEAKSKILIILTDGSNQAGKIDPLDATNAAKTLGIKIYTIGVGSNEPVPVPTQFGYQKVRIELDEELLRDIAKNTGGQYFRASDTEALSEIYRTIDTLEKTTREIEVFKLYDEQFSLLLWPALCLLLGELVFATTRWQRIP